MCRLCQLILVVNDSNSVPPSQPAHCYELGAAHPLPEGWGRQMSSKRQNTKKIRKFRQRSRSVHLQTLRHTLESDYFHISLYIASYTFPPRPAVWDTVWICCIFTCCLCSRDRFGDSEGESLALSPQQGSGGGNWPPDQPEDSDNQRNVRRTGQTSIHIPPVTVTSPPGETTLIQRQCLRRPPGCTPNMTQITSMAAITFKSFNILMEQCFFFFYK